MESKIPLASEVLAKSQCMACSGPDECHWCGAPCERRWPHDDQPLLPFVRKNGQALRPGNSFICSGCWIYRRKRVTVNHLDGRYVDGKSLTSYSWILTPEEIRVVDSRDAEHLYRILLCPPPVFSLSVVNEPLTANLIQRAVVNRFEEEIFADTELHFTLNNVVFVFTVHELEEALRNGGNGRLPGARMLVEYFGRPKESIPGEVKRARGRPRNEDQINVSKKVIRIRSA